MCWIKSGKAALNHAAAKPCWMSAASWLASGGTSFMGTPPGEEVLILHNTSDDEYYNKILQLLQENCSFHNCMFTCAVTLKTIRGQQRQI